MKGYTPLPNDELRKGGLHLLVERVFPEQVAFSFNNGQGPFTVSREEFDTKAQGSFRNGASLWRGGVCLWDPNTETANQPITEPTNPMPTESPTPGITGSSNAHARLSPSDSKRWSNCSAAIAFQEANTHRIKVDDSSFDSLLGTEAHEWAAKLLLGQVAPADIPENFRPYVTAYAAHCMALIPDAQLTHLETCIEEMTLGFEPPDAAFFVEEEIPLWYQPEQYGTADFIALSAEQGTVTRLFARDYKHGAGVLVTSQDNTQLAIYVFSAITRLEGAYTFADDALIDLAIHQPRHREAADQKPWVITLADLRTFCREIEYQAITAREGANRVRERIGSPGRDVSNAEILEAAPGTAFRPSEGDSGACRWCKCKAFCATRLAALTEDVDLPRMSAADMLAAMPDLTKEESKLPVAERLAIMDEVLYASGRIVDDAWLVNLVKRAPGIRALLSNAEEYLESRLLAGDEIPGVKLVSGRAGNRAWCNPDMADSFLKNQGLKMDERYEYVLKSPAKIESLLSEKLAKSPRTKSRFEQLVTRSSPKPVLATSEDKRDSVKPNIAVMPTFEDFEV